MKAINRFIVNCFCLLYPIKIIGKENLPEGGALLASNHLSALDCGYIAKLYGKDISFIAKKELFKNKLIAKLIKSFGGLPIDRENPELKSIISILKNLKEDHKVVIFPEGTRNKNNPDVLGPFKSGTAVFAVKSKKPIVPIAILKKAKIFRKNYLYVGNPFELSEYYDKKLTDEDTKNIDSIIYEQLSKTRLSLKESIKRKR